MVLEHVLVEHATHGVGVHRRGVGGLDDGIDQILGLCGLGFGLLGAGDDRHAVAAHDNRQVRKGALYLANDLVNRAEHGDGVKLVRDGDGTCSRCHEADIPLLLVELFAGHHVRVHVEDGLAGVETGVEHQSVGAVKSPCRRCSAQWRRCGPARSGHRRQVRRRWRSASWAPRARGPWPWD